MWIKRGIQKMLINYTSKLFYKQYAYRILMETVTKPIARWHKSSSKELMQINKWCELHIPENDFRIQHRYQKQVKRETLWYQLIYIKDTQSKDLILQKFGSRIKEIWQPLDQNHEDSLEIRNLVEVRKDLLYKKYRYAIYFKYDRQQTIYNWLGEYYKDQLLAKVSGDIRWPRLYLTDQSEITTIRLTWGDCIQYIKTIRLITDQ